MRRWPIALIIVLLAGALAANACMETRRALGEDCLKDSDCLSGTCSQLRCANPGPILDAQVIAEAAPEDAGVDATGTLPEASPNREDEVDGPVGDGAESGDADVETGDPSADAPTGGDGSGD
jgi:hypothetical protein